MHFNKINNEPEFNVRLSQLLTPFGIGALIDVNNQSLMIADSEYWEKPNEIIHDIRLEKALNCTGFIEPSIEEENEISTIRFPEWYFNPQNRDLKSIKDWKKEVDANLSVSSKKKDYSFYKKPYTKIIKNNRNSIVDLVPVRILCACENGHVQDFPWLDWVHQNTELKKEKYKNHDLKLISRAESAAISELSVYCKQCNKSESLNNIFNRESIGKKFEKMSIKCEGNFHWKKTNEDENCSKIPRVLLRNASNFYFPSIVSSVNLPFKKYSLIERIIKHKDYESMMSTLGKSDNQETLFKTDKRINSYIEYIAEDLNQSINEIRIEIGKHLNIYNDDKSIDTITDYRRAEHNVLMGLESLNEESDVIFRYSQFNQEDFPENSYQNLLSKITLVHSLEVISALKSYSRIYTTDSESLKDEGVEKEEIHKAREVSLKREDGTYVAVKSKGEGIFIELSKCAIDGWYSRVKDTEMVKKINGQQNKIEHDDELEFINSKYYLLHTISHLLIRELTLSSGYSSSALKERIYFSDKKDEEMYGFLIYTSSSDSEGTLGGLVSQGIPENLFKKILNPAIEKAKWCSFDPVCTESDGQGRNSLNIAACHACTLISETSCEKMNIYLDRNVLIGTLEDESLGFFS